jgi:hypothetical protein
MPHANPAQTIEREARREFQRLWRNLGFDRDPFTIEEMKLASRVEIFKAVIRLRPQPKAQSSNEANRCSA